MPKNVSPFAEAAREMHIDATPGSRAHSNRLSVRKIARPSEDTEPGRANIKETRL